MSDQEGEYKSKAFVQLMHNNGIHVYKSALRLILIYYLYQSVATIKGSSLWEITLSLNVAQNTFQSDSIMLEMLSKSIK